jgi:hypothetical protein
MSRLAARPDAVGVGITDGHRVVKTIGDDEFVRS